jgi:hypothetical protein
MYLKICLVFLIIKFKLSTGYSKVSLSNDENYVNRRGESSSSSSNSKIHLLKLKSKRSENLIILKSMTVKSNTKNSDSNNNKRHLTTTTNIIPSDLFKNLQSQLSDLNEPQQFCGETLYYAVEYYCVYVKGTSVYVPDTDLENINVITNQSKRDLINHKGIPFLIFILNFISIKN